MLSCRNATKEGGMMIGTKVSARVPYSDRIKHGEVIAMQDGLAIVKWNGCHVTQAVIPAFVERMVVKDA